ncbi:hypothetical protein BGW37DRAFT_504830 [Umbelopsis sp. PMI_123]|nr:hypothetical protein BGW37DRAFT_504830 [Umbelopsis sp. PMI_123]
MTAARKILVVGGTGFLGQNVCKQAVWRGWEVISLSRRGLPSATTSNSRGEWKSEVQWVAGDSTEPDSYKDILNDVTDVVHTVGMLMENDYKKIVQANSVADAINGMGSVFGQLLGMKDNGNPFKQDSRSKLTYEMMNRDTAISLAKAISQIPSIHSYVYISATDLFPCINPRYITTKREAERYLFSRPEFRSVVLRPGYMYSDAQPATLPLAGVIEVLNTVTGPCSRDIASLPLGTMMTTPALNVDRVAEAVIESIARPNLKGILDVSDMQKLLSTPPPPKPAAPVSAHV